MKRFAALAVLRAAPDTLFTTMRDRLPEIGGQLDDIEQIEQLERTACGNGVRVVNRWVARQRVPALLRDRLGQDVIAWIDRADWSADGTACTWSIEPSIGDDGIACSGETRFEPAMGGRGVRVQFEGSLTIDPAFMTSLAGPFQRPVTALVEAIATTLIPKNLRAAAEVAARFP